MVEARDLARLHNFLLKQQPELLDFFNFRNVAGTGKFAAELN